MKWGLVIAGLGVVLGGILVISDLPSQQVKYTPRNYQMNLYSITHPEIRVTHGPFTFEQCNREQTIAQQAIREEGAVGEFTTECVRLDQEVNDFGQER
jgi:hypothetical protein